MEHHISCNKLLTTYREGFELKMNKSTNTNFRGSFELIPFPRFIVQKYNFKDCAEQCSQVGTTQPAGARISFRHQVSLAPYYLDLIAGWMNKKNQRFVSKKGSPPDAHQRKLGKNKKVHLRIKK